MCETLNFISGGLYSRVPPKLPPFLLSIPRRKLIKERDEVGRCDGCPAIGHELSDTLVVRVLKPVGAKLKHVLDAFAFLDPQTSDEMCDGEMQELAALIINATETGLFLI